MPTQKILSAVCDVLRYDFNLLQEIAKARDYSLKEFVYEDLILDNLIGKFNWCGRCDNLNNFQKDFYYHNDHSWKKFDMKGEQLENNTWNKFERDLTPDIITKDRTNKYIVIEVKRFWYEKKNPFKTHEYNYLYGLTDSINYNFSSFSHSWSDGEYNYEWNGGPIFKETSNNNELLTHWLEGQIWIDIHRLLFVKNNFLNNAKLYFIGFIELKNDDIKKIKNINNISSDSDVKEKLYNRLKQKIADLIKEYKNYSTDAQSLKSGKPKKYIYADFKDFRNNSHRILQRYKIQKLGDYNLTLIPNSDHDIAAAFIIEVC